MNEPQFKSDVDFICDNECTKFEVNRLEAVSQEIFSVSYA